MFNSIELADANNSLSIVNDGSLTVSTDGKNPAQIILSPDGTQVKEIMLQTDITSQRNKTGSVKLKINTTTGKADVEVFSADGQFLGRANVDLTVNGEKTPEISYEKQRSLKKIYTDENIARKGEAVLADDLRYEIGERLQELRNSFGLDQRQMVKEFPHTLPQKQGGYSKWESGKHAVSIQFLRNLAEKWHVDLNWLILGTPMVMPTLPASADRAILDLMQFRRDCLNGK